MPCCVFVLWDEDALSGLSQPTAVQFAHLAAVDPSSLGRFPALLAFTAHLAADHPGLTRTIFREVLALSEP